MPLALDLAQTVVIGRFNPHIVTANWLVTQGICSEADADEQPGAGDYILDDRSGLKVFDLGGFEWEVSFDRLAVSATERNRDCGKMAAAVLDKLPHTPVDAVGNNFIFVCSTADWGNRPTPGLGVGVLTPRESRWVGVYSENEERTEIELTVVPNEVVVIRLNFDCRVNGTKEGQQAANQFGSDYARAGDRIRTLFRADVP